VEAAERGRGGVCRLGRREHVVVGADDAEVGLVAGAQVVLVLAGAGGEGVGLVAAAGGAPTRARAHGGIDARQVGGASFAAALDDAFGGVGDGGMEGHGTTPV